MLRHLRGLWIHFCSGPRRSLRFRLASRRLHVRRRFLRRNIPPKCFHHDSSCHHPASRGRYRVRVSRRVSGCGANCKSAVTINSEYVNTTLRVPIIGTVALYDALATRDTVLQNALDVTSKRSLRVIHGRLVVSWLSPRSPVDSSTRLTSCPSS